MFQDLDGFGKAKLERVCLGFCHLDWLLSNDAILNYFANLFKLLTLSLFHTSAFDFLDKVHLLG